MEPIKLPFRSKAEIEMEKLTDARARAHRTIDTLNTARRKAGFEYNGVVYQADDGMIININGALTAASLGIPVFPFEVKAKDNSSVWYESAESLTAYSGALLMFVQQCYKEAWAAKQQVDAAESEEDIRTICDAYFQEEPR